MRPGDRLPALTVPVEVPGGGRSSQLLIHSTTIY